MSLTRIKRRLNKIKRGKNKRNLNVYLVDDTEITRIKKTFWGIKKPTDVVAFEGDEKLLGEVVISLDTANRQAKERSIPVDLELTLLAVHGLLHLRGYKDNDLPNWKHMRIAEFENMVRVI